MNAWKWVPNALTLGNLLGGVVVCWAAASGSFLGEALVADSMVSGMQEPWPAGAEARGVQMVALVWALAMFCDVLDGWAARKLGVAGPMGVQLDSLADVVTGGVAPAMVAMRLFQDDGGAGMTWEMLACLGVAAAAAYRLARFNVAAESGEGGTDFEGMPAPAAGVYWMGVMLAWGELQGGVEVLWAVALAWIGLFVVPLAMMSRRKMWGLKGLGKDAHRDKWRGVLVAVVPGVQVSAWVLCESVFLAVPLCLLLYLGLAMATTPQSQLN
jgi:CDP-diacylglycerol--serine O-phosphatidyltransferase